MIKKILALAAVIGFAVILWPLVTVGDPPDELSGVALSYVDAVPEDLGGANIVTGIVVTYRGFDTLGEVSVLFLAASGVGFVLSATRPKRSLLDASAGEAAAAPRRGPSEILATGSSLLVPLLMLFGAYVFIHGHLTPGGGFQGGVIIASAVVLSVLGASNPQVSHGALSTIESLSGAFYVGIGLLGIVLAGGFLDTTFLGTGRLGALISAGAIPIIYTLVGLKVGAELIGIIERLRHREGDRTS